VIESIQVSKTFTPDQQGDASGGAVNVKLRGIPDEPVFLRMRGQVGMNSQASGSDFLTYRGGGVNFLGLDDAVAISSTEISEATGPARWVSRAGTPRWTRSGRSGAGGREELESGWKIGGLVNVFYEETAPSTTTARRNRGGSRARARP
jgi:hypothetical protein